MHEDVKKKLQVDVWGVNPSKPRGIGTLPWSEDGYDKLVDEWGIEWWKPTGRAASTTTCGGIRSRGRHRAGPARNIGSPIRWTRGATRAWPRAPTN